MRIKVNPFLGLEDRFWLRVNKEGPPYRNLGPCWLWLGSTEGYGYGIIKDGKVRWTTHRYSYHLRHGSIPEGGCILHHCDNPPCCNPDHLFLGDRISNNLDRDAKGRTAKHAGEENGRAKVNEEAVRQIRTRHKRGCPVNGTSALAREFKLSRSAVVFIINGQNWSHVV